MITPHPNIAAPVIKKPNLFPTFVALSKNVDGLNAFEIRIIPLTFLIGSGILFVMFLLALNRFEQEQLEKEDQDN